MDYKSLMGYGDVKKKKSKPKQNKIVEELKQEFNINEGPSYEYKKHSKKIDKSLKELFKSGIKLGISSRGLGSVKEIHEDEGDSVEVQPDFELIAFDFVSNPSTHGAFLSPTNEGKLNEGVGTRDGVCCHDCKIENIINDIFRGE